MNLIRDIPDLPEQGDSRPARHGPKKKGTKRKLFEGYAG